MNKQQLQHEIAELQKQLEEKQKSLDAMPNKWEPEGGDYWVDMTGCVRSGARSSHKCNAYFGIEYLTREQAEKASKAMRAHNRLLAYVAEFAPDWEPSDCDKKWCVYFDSKSWLWCCKFHVVVNIAGAVYMPEHVAYELVDKLNGGEVEL